MLHPKTYPMLVLAGAETWLDGRRMAICFSLLGKFEHEQPGCYSTWFRVLLALNF